MRLTEEEMQVRRETMIQTAFRLFCDRGIEHVSLSEIARKAHVGENTVYRYFTNKETLVVEAFFKLWDAIIQEVERNVADTPRYDDLTGYHQVRIWIESFRFLYQTHREFVLFSYEAKLYLLRQQVKLSRLHQDTLMRTFRGPCLAALEKGKADGSIPAEENSEDLFYAIFGALRGYIVKIVIYGSLYGEDSPWESRYRIVERGILSALRSGWNLPERF